MRAVNANAKGKDRQTRRKKYNNKTIILKKSSKSKKKQIIIKTHCCAIVSYFFTAIFAIWIHVHMCEYASKKQKFIKKTRIIYVRRLICRKNANSQAKWNCSCNAFFANIFASQSSRSASSRTNGSPTLVDTHMQPWGCT